MNRTIGFTGALLATGALFAACSNSTGISPAAPIDGGGGIPLATPSAAPATPIASSTPTVAPTMTSAPTPTATPTPPPPVTVTPAALTFQQPGQSLPFTASEANYTGGFTAAACQPAGIATVTAVSGSTTMFTVTSTGGGVCTIAVADTTHTGNGATVTVTANNNGIVIQGKKR